MAQGPAVQVSRQQTVSSHVAVKTEASNGPGSTALTESSTFTLDMVDNRTGARTIKNFPNEAAVIQFLISADAANFTIQYERMAGSF